MTGGKTLYKSRVREKSSRLLVDSRDGSQPNKSTKVLNKKTEVNNVLSTPFEDCFFHCIYVWYVKE